MLNQDSDFVVDPGGNLRRRHFPDAHVARLRSYDNLFRLLGNCSLRTSFSFETGTANGARYWYRMDIGGLRFSSCGQPNRLESSFEERAQIE